MLAGLKARANKILFVTVTAPGVAGGLTDDSAIALWNRTAAQRWNHLILLLRRTFHGTRVEYFKVAELQKRGAIHYHLAISGIEFLDTKTLSRLAVRCGFGPICDVQRMRHVGGGCVYFSKYLLKDVLDPQTGAVILHKGDRVKVSPGKMTAEQKKYYWEHQEELLEHVIKFKLFPKGTKDKPRFPTFDSIRNKNDL